MILSNKICFLINWSRELNMFEEIYNKIDKENIFFVINDLNKGPRNNSKDLIRIKQLIDKKNFNHNFLSKILNKKKFKVVISTGDLPINFFSIKNFFKFIYGKTIGNLFKILGLNLIFKKYLGREFIAEGNDANFFDNVYIENSIGVERIKYPNGLDRNIKHFPNIKWSKIFNIYFTSSLIEEDLINKKFENKKIHYVGYPRFKVDKDIIIDRKKSVLEEFNFKKNKKNILCLPNERIMSFQTKNEISNYLIFLKKISQNFNLLLRPHPKIEYYNLDLYHQIINSKLTLDLDHSRRMEDIFNFADLVLCDYGSSLLESIYLKKKIIIYEWKNEKLFKKLNDKENCLDYLVRKKLLKIYSGQENNFDFINKKLIKILEDLSYQKKITSVHSELFGDLNKASNPINIIKNLYEKNL